MNEESDSHEPMPSIVWWLLGAVTICFIVMWGYGGLSRTLWWLGLLVGSTAIAIATLWIRDSVDYDSSLHTLTDITARLFWCATLLLFLFGLLVTGKAILDPLWSSLTGPGGYSERYSDSFD